MDKNKKHIFIILGIVLMYFTGKGLGYMGLVNNPRCFYSMLCSTLICEILCFMAYMFGKLKYLTTITLLEFVAMCFITPLCREFIDVVGIAISLTCFCVGIYDLKSLGLLSKKGDKIEYGDR